MLKGVAVSRGIAEGAAYVLDDAVPLAVPRRTIDDGAVASELARFAAALDEAEACLREVRDDLERQIGSEEARVFEADMLLLRDPTFSRRVTEHCAARKINVEAAVADVVEELALGFAALDDVYFRERAADVRDVGRRVLERLLTHRCEHPRHLPDGVILVAVELLPSATARVNLQAVRGIVTERGGRTSHTSILTRSLGIPGVVAVAEAVRRIKSGDTLIVDGMAGSVHVNPSPRVRDDYARSQAEFLAYRNSLAEIVALPAETADGAAVELSANVGKIADAEAAMLFEADGVGLYRTEFGFLVRDRFPSATEQHRMYEAVVDRLRSRPAVIRLLDVGSDKPLSYFPMAEEPNPALGRRGTRLLLRHPDLLRAQLEAILRLSATHAVSVLLPMIGAVEEVVEVKAVMADVAAGLRRAKVPCNSGLPVGAMIETPAAAVLARELAQEVDFLSVGTNDLVQYLLSADRTSETMTAYYEPLHPAVLRTLHAVVEAGRAAGKKTSVCGEMAGNPAYAELLLGLGVRSFSVTPGEILEIKKVIRAASLARARQLAARVLTLRTVEEIKACCRGSGVAFAAEL
ncbi:MAG: phosphoenolpyruvate--protein phosphotransferase [Deltaproteobacteria bacterium]|nr:phosphoenolpyruvate--protein phosphotransferase [Deltaproteobacteria bacterium]